MQRLSAGTLIATVLVVVVGLAVGGWLAVRTRPSQEARQRVTVETSVRTPGPQPTVAPTTTPIATPASTPIATPAPTPVAVMTTAPRAVVTEAAVHSSLQGSWQFDEANVQVGTILWVGSAAMDGGNSLVFDVHKQSVGGRAATRCEQATGLHATLSLGVADQTVPYREVNCQGVVSTGEVRITGFAANSGHFSGSFWSNGANLGHFDARKL